MDNDLKELLADFRKLKLEKDYEHYAFFSYRLGLLIEKYDELDVLRKDIQETYFKAAEDILNEGLDLDFDINRWERIRSAEDSEWNFEINQIRIMKYEIDQILLMIESGEAEEMILAEEEELTGDDIR